MANISNYLEDKILDTVMKNGNVEWLPETVYAGLVTTTAVDADLEAGTLTNEVTDYTGDRKAITFGDIAQVGGKATVSNSNVLEFEDMPEATIGYLIICDAATGSNILWWCPVVGDPKTTNAGDTFRVPIGDLVIDLD